MKVTYTANDGITFDTEDECRGYEAFTKAIEEDRYRREPYEDPEDVSAFDSFLEWMAPNWPKKGQFGEKHLWTHREFIYRIVNLLKQSEVT